MIRRATGSVRVLAKILIVFKLKLFEGAVLKTTPCAQLLNPICVAKSQPFTQESVSELHTQAIMAPKARKSPPSLEQTLSNTGHGEEREKK